MTEEDEQPIACELPAFDPACYPRSYRQAPIWRVLQLAAGVALLAAGMVLLAAAFPPWSARLPQTWQPAALPAGLSLLLWGGLAGAHARRLRVVLHADAIEVHGVSRVRSVMLGRIAGRRRQAQGLGFVQTCLVLHPGSGRKLCLPSTLATDGAFHVWLDRLPDLDAVEREASLQAVLANPLLGRTPEQRLQRLAWVNRVAQLGLPLVVALLVWTMLSARAPIAAVLVIGLLPWLIVAAVAGARGALRLDGSPHDVRPNLLGVLGLACVALLPRLLAEINLHSWAALVPAALAAGAAMSWWALRVSARHGQRSARRWAMVPLLWVYCGAALAWLNVLADQRTTRVDPTVANFKHWGGGRRLTFALRLEPWGALREIQSLQVSQAVFNSVSPGERVCVREHPGLWGWRWTDVAPCPEDAPVVTNGMPAPLYRALKLHAYGPERRGPHLRLLVAGQHAELDAQLGELQRRFEHGEVGSELLLVSYRDFYDPDPDLDTLFDGWIARFPGSYPARLARGIHRKFQAEGLHAAGFERWVSPDANVELYADRQIKDLERSTKLTAKPTLSYVHLMDAAMHRGERTQMRQWLERGLSAEPESFALTRKYLAMLRPMYGGSLPEMEAFVAECHRNGLPANVTNTLDAMLLTQRGWASQREGHEDIALTQFREAAALDPFGEDLNMALRQEADILVRRKQFDAAIAVLQRALQAQPDEARTHGMLGYALHGAGRKPEAIAEYERAAQLGDGWSQAYLGRLYLGGGHGVARDAVQAQHWLGRAAAAGNEDARRALREHPELRPR